jgi:hypothetical protein
LRRSTSARRRCTLPRRSAGYRQEHLAPVLARMLGRMSSRSTGSSSEGPGRATRTPSSGTASSTSATSRLASSRRCGHAGGPSSTRVWHAAARGNRAACASSASSSGCAGRWPA